MKDLDQLYNEKIDELEMQDPQKLVPILLASNESQQRSYSIPAISKSKSLP